MWTELEKGIIWYTFTVKKLKICQSSLKFITDVYQVLSLSHFGTICTMNVSWEFRERFLTWCGLWFCLGHSDPGLRHSERYNWHFDVLCLEEPQLQDRSYCWYVPSYLENISDFSFMLHLYFMYACQRPFYYLCIFCRLKLPESIFYCFCFMSPLLHLISFILK
jgi:hypothetical protein